MKKISIVLMAALLGIFTSMCGVFAEDEPIVPEFDENSSVKLYEFMDFDTTANSGEWSVQDRVIADGDGNKVYSVYGAYDYFGKNTLQNSISYTVEFNAKINSGSADYNGGIIIKQHPANENIRMFIQFYTKENKIKLIGTNGNPTVEGTVPDFASYDGKWVYIKVESIADTTRVYFNDKTTPVIEYKETSYSTVNPLFGCVRFVKGNASSFYVDNLLITKPLPQSAPSEDCVIPAPEDDKYVILNQNFDDLDPTTFTPAESGWDFTSVGNGAAIGTAKSNCNQYIDLSGTGKMAFTTRSNYKNFTMEFNMLLADAFGDGAEIHFYRPGFTSPGYHVDFQIGKDTGTRWAQYIRLKNGSSVVKECQVDFSAYNTKWVYVKIECYNGDVKVYFGDKNTPVIEYTFTEGSLIPEGKIGFINRTASYMQIDNLILSTPEMPRQLDTSAAPSFSCDGDEEAGYTVNYSHYIINFYPEDCNPVFILAAFDKDGKLVAVNAEKKMINGNLPDGKLEATEVKMALPLEAPAMNYDIQVFIWDSLDSLMPYVPEIPYN